MPTHPTVPHMQLGSPDLHLTSTLTILNSYFLLTVPSHGNEGGGEDEDEYEGGAIDSSDDEDDTAGSVACTIGNAVAPAGYKIVDECISPPSWRRTT